MKDVRTLNGRLVCKYDPDTGIVEVKPKGEKEPLRGNIKLAGKDGTTHASYGIIKT